jgi:hypothetical protein
MGNNEGIHWLDAGAVGMALGTFFGWLPNIAALLSVIWLLLRIWEMDTVKRWTGRAEKAPLDIQWLRDAIEVKQKEKDDE